MVPLNLNSTLVKASLNSCVLNFNLEVTYLFFILVLLLAAAYMWGHKTKKKLDPVELEFDVRLLKCKFKVQRNYENIELAHKIYTELITRKGALIINPNEDVITEIYDSWYALFKITREELKLLSGESILDNDSKELVEMVTKILNNGLRPHLTNYQARFRKWYGEQLEDPSNKGKSPQQIQKGFPEYNELVRSMQDVNCLLIEYCKQLRKFIYGTETSSS